MGGSGSKSKSSTTNKSDTTIVNENDLKLLNKSVNDFVSNTVVSQASDCSQSMTQLQDIDFSNMDIGGDLNIGSIDQKQSAAISFDCVQLSSFKNDIANGVLNKYMNAIDNSYDASATSEMTAAAQSSAQTQFGATGKSKSDSTSNNDYKFKSVNKTKQDIQNVVENSITNNLSMEDTQSCIAGVLSSQKISTSGTKVDGSFNVGAITQNQATSMMTSCVQKKDNGNKISNDIAADLGLEVSSESVVSTDTKMAASSTSEASNTGVFQSMGEGIATMSEGIGNAFGTVIGSVSSGMSQNPISVVVCAIVCCLLIGVGGYVGMTQLGGGHQNQMQEFDMLKFVILVILFVVVFQVMQNK